MDERKVSSVSQADTLEKMGEFWDTHEFTDFDNDAPDVEFEITGRGFMNIQSLLESVPTPTAEEMAGRRAFARQYTLVFLRKGPAPRDDEARNERLQLEHLQHLTKLQMVGKLVLNGPVLEEHEILGVSVYAAGLEEARALAEADPKVQAGYLTVEAIPWMAVPSDTNSG